MTAHIPDVVTTTDTAGRAHAKCLACMESSPPSFHRPLVDDWRKAHIKAALNTNKEKP